MPDIYSIDPNTRSARSVGQKSPGEAIHRVNSSIQSLFRHYGSLANLYLKDGTQAYGQEVVMALGGGVLLFLGWIAFVVATIAVASPDWIPYWASIGFWALVHLGLGTYMVMHAISAFRGKSENKKSYGSTKDYIVDRNLGGYVP